MGNFTIRSEKAVCGVVLRILCECALAGRMYLFTSARPAAAQ